MTATRDAGVSTDIYDGVLGGAPSDPRTRLGRAAARRFLLPNQTARAVRHIGSPMGRVAASARRFATVAARPVTVRRLLGEVTQVRPVPAAITRPPRWWVPELPDAGAGGAAGVAGGGPAGAGPAGFGAAAALPPRGLPRVTAPPPTEKGHMPGRFAAAMHATTVRVQRLKDVAAIGGLTGGSTKLVTPIRRSGRTPHGPAPQSPPGVAPGDGQAHRPTVGTAPRSAQVPDRPGSATGTRPPTLLRRAWAERGAAGSAPRVAPPKVAGPGAAGLGAAAARAAGSTAAPGPVAPGPGAAGPGAAGPVSGRAGAGTPAAPGITAPAPSASVTAAPTPAAGSVPSEPHASGPGLAAQGIPETGAGPTAGTASRAAASGEPAPDAAPGPAAGHDPAAVADRSPAPGRVPASRPDGRSAPLPGPAHLVRSLVRRVMARSGLPRFAQALPGPAAVSLLAPAQPTAVTPDARARQVPRPPAGLRASAGAVAAPGAAPPLGAAVPSGSVPRAAGSTSATPATGSVRSTPGSVAPAAGHMSGAVAPAAGPASSAPGAAVATAGPVSPVSGPAAGLAVPGRSPAPGPADPVAAPGPTDPAATGVAAPGPAALGLAAAARPASMPAAALRRLAPGRGRPALSAGSAPGAMVRRLAGALPGRGGTPSLELGRGGIPGPVFLPALGFAAARTRGVGQPGSGPAAASSAPSSAAPPAPSAPPSASRVAAAMRSPGAVHSPVPPRPRGPVLLRPLFRPDSAIASTSPAARIGLDAAVPRSAIPVMRRSISRPGAGLAHTAGLGHTSAGLGYTPAGLAHAAGSPAAGQLAAGYPAPGAGPGLPRDPWRPGLLGSLATSRPRLLRRLDTGALPGTAPQEQGAGQLGARPRDAAGMRPAPSPSAPSLAALSTVPPRPGAAGPVATGPAAAARSIDPAVAWPAAAGLRSDGPLPATVRRTARPAPGPAPIRPATTDLLRASAIAPPRGISLGGRDDGPPAPVIRRERTGRRRSAAVSAGSDRAPAVGLFDRSPAPAVDPVSAAPPAAESAIATAAASVTEPAAEAVAAGSPAIAGALSSREWAQLVDEVTRRIEDRVADEMARRGRRFLPRSM